MVFQWRIIRPKISFASSRLANSAVCDRSPPKTSRLYSLGITTSGPAIRAAKNPSSSSRFIALPPLQPFRKLPRRSSSASVSGSDWGKGFTVVAAHPTLADAAASGSHFGNTLRILLRTFCAVLAPRRRPRTGARRGQPPPLPQLPAGWDAQKPPTARSNLPRGPCTWDCARSDRSPQLLAASAGRPGRVYRALSVRSPRRSAGRRRTPARTEWLPASANAPRPLCSQRTRAIAATARTTARRGLHLLRAIRPQSAIRSDRFVLEQPPPVPA